MSVPAKASRSARCETERCVQVETSGRTKTSRTNTGRTSPFQERAVPGVGVAASQPAGRGEGCCAAARMRLAGCAWRFLKSPGFVRRPCERFDIGCGYANRSLTRLGGRLGRPAAAVLAHRSWRTTSRCSALPQLGPNTGPRPRAPAWGPRSPARRSRLECNHLSTGARFSLLPEDFRDQRRWTGGRACMYLHIGDRRSNRLTTG